MVTITNTSLRQTIWETIYDLINAGTYSSSVNPTITAAYIDGDHSPFPQIVINPIDVAFENPSLGSDRRTSNKNITINIDIYTKKNKDLDVLSDEVDYLMRTDHTGISMINSSETVGEAFPNNQKLRIKTLSYTFIRR